ncbi:hypothetical protein EPUS_08588 [Endocarpon pusillum Z07020]|uniref:Deoxycytidylate deaminase n=1 Tax=Endocarpon pusillum (strain Z07020 / HMAS-L-300199) TaxID=1263415 RepID=U1GFK5_ENDPU|nr:uncharacterized protein EPUS_08588 [Endocarpon pusillum Z07020]ERF70526.1 hypothetical protein EPUS_08588 [Endocarpon pusillum Z07020]
MLIGICGGICAGKHSVAEYLVQHHHFLRLHLPNTPSNLHVSDPDDVRRLLPSISDQRGTRGLTFPDVDSLLDFVTRRWREHWVLTDIHSESTLDLLLRRPFFLLISVDAPTSLRYTRFSARCTLRSLTPPPLDKFILCNPPRPLPSPHPQPLHHPSLPRPTWDKYFMHLSTLASTRSNCMKRRVGAVLVRNNRVISTGYNGTPRNLTNCNEGGCPRCNGGKSGQLNTCLCLHAEENALLEAGRERIGDREGGILYCDTCPCLTCAVKIVQVGIEEVVYAQGYNMDEDTARVLEEGGVRLRQFTPERSGLVSLGLEGKEEEEEEEEAVNGWLVNGGGLEGKKALVKMKDDIANR